MSPPPVLFRHNSSDAHIQKLIKVAMDDPELTLTQLASRFGMSTQQVSTYLEGIVRPSRANLTIRRQNKNRKFPFKGRK